MAYYPGIFNEKARHSDYLSFRTRLQTFNEEENDFTIKCAKAGFYLSGTGYYGCATCFYCGTQIRGLEQGDNVWAQHAENSPDCEYLKLHKGEKFCQKACDMERREETLKQEEEKDLYNSDTDQMIEDLNSRPSMMMMDKGYTQEEVEQGILKARQKYAYGELKAASILESLLDIKSIKTPSTIYTTAPSTSTNTIQATSKFAFQNVERTEPLDEDHKKLLDENHALKSRMTCKVCMDENACILFKPCGHMVSCTKCAHKLKTCAVCRAEITEKIRVYSA